MAWIERVDARVEREAAAVLLLETDAASPSAVSKALEMLEDKGIDTEDLVDEELDILEDTRSLAMFDADAMAVETIATEGRVGSLGSVGESSEEERVQMQATPEGGAMPSSVDVSMTRDQLTGGINPTELAPPTFHLVKIKEMHPMSDGDFRRFKWFQDYEDGSLFNKRDRRGYLELATVYLPSGSYP